MMDNLETYTKIVTCTRCRGEGYTEKWNDLEREYDQVVCSTCGGLRVLEKIVSVEFKKIEHARKTEISRPGRITKCNFVPVAMICITRPDGRGRVENLERCSRCVSSAKKRVW